MTIYPDDSDIKKLIEFVKEKKYEKTVACFEIIDNIDKFKLPKNVSAWKLPLKSFYVLSNDLAKYDYITNEQKEQLLLEKEEMEKLEENFDHLPIANEETEEEKPNLEADRKFNEHVQKSQITSEDDESEEGE